MKSFPHIGVARCITKFSKLFILALLSDKINHIQIKSKVPWSVPVLLAPEDTVPRGWKSLWPLYLTRMQWFLGHHVIVSCLSWTFLYLDMLSTFRFQWDQESNRCHLDYGCDAISTRPCFHDKNLSHSTS